MNTLAHIAALGAVLWLSVFCFDTLGNNVLGTVFIVIFFYFIVATIYAVGDDFEEYRDR